MMTLPYHNYLLVTLSVFIAVFASFTALSLARRVQGPVRWIRRAWLGAAAIALGGGIWSMHFVGMLAFSLPGIELAYDVWQTYFSLIIAIGFTAGGLAVGALRPQAWPKTCAAGLLMGSGVAAMHYLGMAALRLAGELTFDPTWVAISIAIAVVASTIAAHLAFQEQKLKHLPIASVVMGLAISGMHYAGMHAATFHSRPDLATERQTNMVAPSELALAVSIVTVVVLLVALGAAQIDRLLQRIARREARIALRLRVADLFRDANTTRALNEVATLMGKHFAVTRTGYAMLDPEEDVFDYEVCWTDGTVPPLLGRYPAAAFGTKIVAQLNAGKTVVVSDLQSDELSDEVRTLETARDVDTRSILVVPFVREGRLRTIVYLNDRVVRRWEPQDIAFMEELAERTRLVIERAAAEEQLRQLNATLERRVELRTQELREAQEALLQSQKMEAVGQLVAGLAHDFNNVLGAVIGAFNLIKRRAADPQKVQELAEAGSHAAERGTALTSQLMAFSRSHKLQTETFLVCDIIKGMRDLLARTLGPMIVLELRLNPRPQAVMGNANQVEMMILNLAINARDAMPDGGVLTVGTRVVVMQNEPDIEPGPYVEIAVSDTGQGMDDETRRRAMEPFFTTKPVGKGTGLGLAQIYGSARQAGGTVRIESEPGVGTTVRILLPRSSEVPEIAASGGESALTSMQVQSLNIVLVDDDADLLFLLSQGLSDYGHGVLAFSDGQSALDHLSTSPAPDLLVTDFAMPKINGAQLATAALKLWPSLPMIFMSGYADTTAIKQSAGENAVLIQKPFKLDELISVIGKARTRN